METLRDKRSLLALVSDAAFPRLYRSWPLHNISRIEARDMRWQRQVPWVRRLSMARLRIARRHRPLWAAGGVGDNPCGGAGGAGGAGGGGDCGANGRAAAQASASYAGSVSFLASLQARGVPEDMMAMLLSAVKKIHGEAFQLWGKSVRGSDDLVPLMVYVALRAASGGRAAEAEAKTVKTGAEADDGDGDGDRIGAAGAEAGADGVEMGSGTGGMFTAPYACLSFLNDFQDLSRGEASYYWTTLYAAVRWVNTLRPVRVEAEQSGIAEDGESGGGAGGGGGACGGGDGGDIIDGPFPSSSDLRT